MTTVAITGATGFIGRNLMTHLLQLDGFRIKILTRAQSSEVNGLIEVGIEQVEGDLLDFDSLHHFLEEGCIVINLVYLWDAGESQNIIATNNLLKACKAASVRRLIHCSTAAVVGRTHANLITEDTVCEPITEYGRTKLKIEKMILDSAVGNFEATIVRPTAVFGKGGEPLKKLINDLTTKSWFTNYLKSCLFGKRRMNLVSITNVVGVIIFLINHAENIQGEKFIISDDDNDNNNFVYVEHFLMKGLNVPDYILPRLPLPLNFLSFLLACLGRNNINPRCNYSSDKLLKIGYQKDISFDNALAEYVDWHQATRKLERMHKAI